MAFLKAAMLGTDTRVRLLNRRGARKEAAWYGGCMAMVRMDLLRAYVLVLNQWYMYIGIWVCRV